MKSESRAKRHRYHSPLTRGIYCLALSAAVLGFGTIGLRLTENFSWIDAFYFTSMIATGQGPAPPLAPATTAGKLFTSLLAFVSAGAMITSLGFLFGPFLGKLWRIGVLRFEEEVEHLNPRARDKNAGGKADFHA